MVGRRGFTLIEMLVVIAIISTLLSIAVPRYFDGVKRAEEATLRQNLALIRDSIDKYYADAGRYPDALDDLATKRYLRAVPIDPITGTSDSWTVVPPANPGTGRVYDVRSGASGNGRDGTAYGSW